MFKNVKELAEKRSHLRKGVEELMKEFAVATAEAEGIHAMVITEEENGYEYDLCIRTGCRDLYWDSSQGFSKSESRWNDWSKDYSFYNGMSIKMLRKVCAELPKAFQNIQKQIDAEVEELAKLAKKLS